MKKHHEKNPAALKSIFKIIHLPPEKNTGETLMSDALAWMDKQKVKSKIIRVVYGNEYALNFYKKFNFFPSSIKLIQK